MPTARAAASDISSKDTKAFEGKAWLEYVAECEKGERCGMHVIAVRVTNGVKGKVCCFVPSTQHVLHTYHVSFHVTHTSVP